RRASDALPADFHVAVLPGQLLLVDDGAHVGVFSQRVAQAQLLDAFHQPLLQLVHDGLVHQQPAGRGAALARGAEGAPQNGFRGQVQVGVVRDGNGVLAAHLPRLAVAQWRGLHRNGVARLLGAGELDDPYERVFHHRHARLLAGAQTHVDDARRQARFLHELDQLQGNEGRILRGFPDYSVARDEGRRQLPRRHRNGEVPRRDEANDADGIPHRVRELVRHLRRRGEAEQAAAFAGHVVKLVDGFLHVAPGFKQHLAHFPGHEPRQLFLALLDELGDAVEDFSAPGRRGQPPLLEGFVRRARGQVHFRGPRDGRPPQKLARGGVDVRVELARAARYRPAADPAFQDRGVGAGGSLSRHQHSLLPVWWG